MDEFAIRKTLADQLFKIIARNGWSNSIAADFLGIHRNELSGILNQKKDVRLSTLSLIAAGVGRPIAALICPETAQQFDNAEAIRRIQADLRKLQKGGAVC